MAQNQEISTAQLLAVFPSEVWTQILDKLIDPEDLMNCCKAISLFKKILETRRVHYLFPRVLEILDTNSYLDYDLQVMRSCRLVCWSWSLSTTRFLEKIHPSRFMSTLSNTTHRVYSIELIKDPTLGTVFSLYSSRHSNVTKLEQQIVPELTLPFYKNHNPFPSRFLEVIEIDSCSPAMTQRYRDSTEKILNNVGHHVWHLRIKIFPDHSWYKQLHRYIQLLPNLKSLHLLHNEIPARRGVVPENGEVLLRCYNSIITKQVNEFPFPTLPNLILLSLQDLPHAALKEVINSNRHVVALEIVPSKCIHWQLKDYCYYHRSVSRIGNNLTSLSISLTSPKDTKKLRNCWKLESLRLECPMLPSPIVHWSTIWRKVKRYSKTLTELAVNMHFEEFAAGKVPAVVAVTRFPVKLPKLKKLWISLPGDCSMDFLVGFKSLEFLSVKMSSNLCVNKPIVKLPTRITPKLTSAEDILKCDIWEKIPTLKVVEWWEEETNDFRKYIREQVETCGPAKRK